MNKQELIYKIEKLPYNLGPIVDAMKINRAGLIKLIEQLDEPQRVEVPQFVVDWYEEHKDDLEISIFHYVNNINKEDESAFKRWFVDSTTKPFQILVNMHQFGYEVEKEKRFLVKMKGHIQENVLVYGYGIKRYFFSSTLEGNRRPKHTRKQLEKGGFGDVFNNPMFEVEEVE